MLIMFDFVKCYENIGLYFFDDNCGVQLVVNDVLKLFDI